MATVSDAVTHWRVCLNIPRFSHYRTLRRDALRTLMGGTLALLLVTSSAVADQSAPAASAPAAQGDFAGLIDIGGHRLYLECYGAGSPTVVLEAGLADRADIWSRDLHEPAGNRTMVLPGVASFTRVCAYDRPGTTAEVAGDVSPPAADEAFLPSRSDPVPMPRTAKDVVADLHGLLRAAAIPGPYVLVGHSFGGLFVRLYASTYPDEVVGLVLIDSTHEEVWVQFQANMTPTQWAAFERVQFETEPPDAYPDFERMDAIASTAQMRQARVDAALRPMPLAVLAHSRPFDAPFPDWPGPAMEEIMLAMNRDLAALVPNARLSVASESGHYIHQEQPALVIEAIRQVAMGVREPDSWYDLAVCCGR
jgi:pimeloyl-ACP methyl ester carboxylesterase